MTRPVRASPSATDSWLSWVNSPVSWTRDGKNISSSIETLKTMTKVTIGT